MVDVERVLARLVQLQAEWAMASALKPQGTGAFDYGVACGRVKGLKLAEEEIKSMITQDASEDAEREKL